MTALPRVIQGLIVFSTVLGAVFLWQAYPVLPTDAFGFVAFGWVLFVVDCILTVVRPLASYYLGVVLAVVALGSTLSEPAHFTLVESGNLLASATIVLGSTAEILLAATGVYYLLTRRRTKLQREPGGNSQV